MPSIVNGLFAGRSGIASHGTAIAVVGDNISNANTIGYKASRAEFADVLAGGQAEGKTVGSGSTTSAVSSIFQQGTQEVTGRTLDLAIDGNGFFVVADNNGQRFYTRAGNFKVDNAGVVIDQAGNQVLGFPSNGSGALQSLNINQVSQTGNVNTQNVVVTGNLDASGTTTVAAVPGADPADGTAPVPTTDYASLSNSAEFSTVVDVVDSLGARHTVTLFFYKLTTPTAGAANTFEVRAYINNEDMESGSGTSGVPTVLQDSTLAADATMTLDFDGSGALLGTSTSTMTARVPWSNGAATGTAASDIDFDLSGFTGFAASSNIGSITQDGQGIGSVTSINVQSNGDIFALLDNGQSTIIGTIGMVNFSNPEGLVRVGGNLLQQTPNSGEPIVGRPETGTYGAINAGAIELSTVDIASEFVKLITLQRGFQANSRIITTINQLLNEIIQLA